MERRDMVEVLPEFAHCGICLCYHPVGFESDCRDDNNRFAGGQLDERYGADGWEEVEEEESDD